MSDSALKIFLKGSAITIAGNVVLGILNYLVRRNLSFSLTAVEYGSFYGMMSLCAIMLAFLDLGIVQAGVVLIADHPDEKKEIFTCLLKIKIVLGLTGALFLVVFRKIITTHYLGNANDWLIILFAVYLILQSSYGACNAYLNGRKKYAADKILHCSEALFLLFLVFFLTPIFHISGAISAYIVSIAVFFPIQIFYILREGKFLPGGKIPFNMYKQFFSLVGIITIVSAMQSLLFNMDSVMLTLLAGPEYTAVYNIAIPIVQILLAFMVFACVFLPISVELVKEKKYSLLNRYVLWGVAITVFLLLPIYPGTIFCGEFIIRLLFGPRCTTAANAVLPWLLSGYIVFSLASFITQILITLNALKFLLTVAILSVVSNFFLNQLLIPKFQCSGAAAATFFSYVIMASLLAAGYFSVIHKLQRNNL